MTGGIPSSCDEVCQAQQTLLQMSVVLLIFILMALSGSCCLSAVRFRRFRRRSCSPSRFTVDLRYRCAEAMRRAWLTVSRHCAFRSRSCKGRTALRWQRMLALGQTTERSSSSSFAVALSWQPQHSRLHGVMCS